MGFDLIASHLIPGSMSLSCLFIMSSMSARDLSLPAWKQASRGCPKFPNGSNVVAEFEMFPATSEILRSCALNSRTQHSSGSATGATTCPRAIARLIWALHWGRALTLMKWCKIKNKNHHAHQTNGAHGGPSSMIWRDFSRQKLQLLIFDQSPIARASFKLGYSASRFLNSHLIIRIFEKSKRLSVHPVRTPNA